MKSGLVVLFALTAIIPAFNSSFAQDSLEFFIDKTRNVAVSAEYVPPNQPEGKLRFIVGTPAAAPVAADPVTAAGKFISQHAPKFGTKYSGVTLSVIGSQADDNGYDHVIYGQKYMGYPVLGGEINVNVDGTNKVTGAIGRIARIVPFTPAKKISSTTAKTKAVTAWKKVNPGITPSATVQGPFVFVPGHIIPNGSRLASLVWTVSMTSDDPPREDTYLVNTVSGAIVYKASGERRLDRRVGDCTLYSQFGACGNYDRWNASHTYRYGRREGYTPAGTNPTYGGTDVDDAYEYLAQLDTFIATKYGRNGLNGQGGSCNGSNCPVSAWRIFTYLEGITPANGPFCGTFQYSTMQLCNGAAIPDVIAHEAMHGLMMYNYHGIPNAPQGTGTGLNYSGQSGAIEEGIADVVGNHFEDYRLKLTNPGASGDWKLQKHRDVSYGFHRDSANPGALSSVYGAYPDRIGGSYYCGTGDLSGVHQNSTVLSHAFYYMANGGTFNGTKIIGIGLDRAVKIGVAAATGFGTATSPSFATMANAIVQACQALYPMVTAQDRIEDVCNRVRVAVLAAEMDKTPCTGGTAPYTSTVSCRDTDAENQYTAGSVSADGYLYKDTCSGSLATEWTCQGAGNTRMAKVKFCTKGCADSTSCRP